MNIYMYSAYQEMKNNGQWTGGWVQLMDGTIVYITTTGEIERKENNNELGSEENPFSYTAYLEMTNKHEWKGGYVMTGEDCEYFPSQEQEEDGCGCGCGCGSGEGCGCGNGSCMVEASFTSVSVISPNMEVIYPNGQIDYKNVRFIINVSWTSGSACVGGSSELSCGIPEADISGQIFTIANSSIEATAEWVGEYLFEVNCEKGKTTIEVPEIDRV